MKKYLVSILLVLGILLSPLSTAIIHAADTTAVDTVQAQDLPQEGSWIKDPEVTTIGKNAARSGQLLDWTLRDYKWASDSAYSNNPLVPLWQTIQRIVYALFLFVILVTAFILIITRGRSLSAKRFLPRFFLVVLLVTFSFSLVQFLYQIIDIFQGFFLRNQAGQIISQKDLLYVGFNYQSFQGLRVFGQSFDESAFISLLLVKLTAFTYYAMVILLIFRKIILWFLIIVSPIFPLLLLFYPLRNTAKIWVGEFFRWLLYAPLFAVFLSGLVRLWHSGLPLIFNFSGVNNPADAVYPTAINILLGGPGQNIGLNNSVNLPDTFALYLVALLMLWTVIILPFILLQIFLDYMMAFNYQNNPLIKQVYTMLNNRPVAPLTPLPPGTPPPATTGLARALPFAKRFEIPKTTGLARDIPTTASRTVERPTLVTRNNQTEVSRLTNLSIPTMRDIARYESTRLSHDVNSQREIERMKQTLINIANPTTVASSTERDRLRVIKEKLVTESQKGNSVATNILNAATTYTSYSSQSSASSVSQQMQSLVQHLAQPTLITSKRDQQKIVEIKQELGKAAKEGNQFATTILNNVNNYTTNQVTNLQQLLQGISHPEKVTNTSEKANYTTLREKIMAASKSGNPLATMLAQNLDNASSPEQVRKIQDQLLEAKAQGNPLAAELLKTVSTSDKTTEKDMEQLHTTLEEASKKGDPLATLLLKTLTSQKAAVAPVSATAKLKSGTLPQVNRIQQVSLEDYEAVKKMWKENYKNVEVPVGQSGRKEWIQSDIASIQETVNLLSSSNPQEVEQGMQQVSDILPFLLIGGFSQTEMIAYLKAKIEAGKNVLEDTTTQQDEEDTLVETKQAVKTETKHLAASAEIDEKDTSISAPTTVVNNYNYSTTNTTNNDETNTVVNQTAAPNAPFDVTLLKKTELSVPKLTDIARFETKSETKESSQITSIKNVLEHLSHPERITDTKERERMVQIRDEVIKESSENNPLATMILSATQLLETLPSKLSESERSQFATTMLALVTPEIAGEKNTVQYFQELHDKLAVLTRSNDPLAVEITNEATKLKLNYQTDAETLLTRLSNPENLSTASEQMHYKKLVERVAQASEDRNTTAQLVLKTLRAPLTQESIVNLIAVINTNASHGDELAIYLKDEVASVQPETQAGLESLYKKLIEAKSTNNTLATSLLRAFTKQLHPAAASVTSATIPTKNRIQQVSLEDYESVKKLWSDNYSSAEPPANTTREAWITKETTDISDTINLLASSDPNQVQMGMDRVGEILPFLLLGGFSKEEITGYLKAKLEAGKSVLTTLQQSDEQTLLSVKNTAQKTANTQTMQAAEVTVSEADQTLQTAPQIKLTVPTLRDVASFETQSSQQGSMRDLARVLSKSLQNLSLTADESAQLNSLKKSLQTRTAQGDQSAATLMALTASSEAPLIEDTPTAIMNTLQGVLDPSLIALPLQQEFRSAREELVKSRQSGNESAATIMTVMDKVSAEQTQSTMKFLQYLDNPLQITDDKLREVYSTLKETLEREKTSDNVSSTLLSLAHGEITPVAANKARVLLLENRTQNENAAQIMQQFISIPSTTQQEITTIYQQLEKKGDPFAKVLVKLVNDRLAKQQHKVKPARLPKQNNVQKVSLDDYEAIKKMFYERFIKGDVPKTRENKEQSREEWVTEEKSETENVINLLTSESEENITQGMKLVGDILPFLLLGGFSHDEVLGYLKAKKEAAVMALATLSGANEPESLVNVANRAKSQTEEQAVAIPLDKPE